MNDTADRTSGDLPCPGLILASSWMTEIPELQFSGLAYPPGAVVINQDGVTRYKAAFPLTDLHSISEGRFAMIASDGDHFFAFTDTTGQEQLYYFSETRGWAVSNSLLALCEHLRANGVSLVMRTTALHGFLCGHSLCDQLVSHRTPVESVFLLPADKRLRVSRRDTFSQVVDRVSQTQVVRSEDDYATLLHRYAAKWASRSAALVHALPADHIKIDITGGVDSRTVLALMMAGTRHLDTLNFISNPAAKVDYSIASLLGESLGFRVKNRPFPLKQPPADISYRLWKYGNVGVYAPVYRPGTTMPGRFAYFHGAGGELLRPFYRNPPSKMISILRDRFPSQRTFSGFRDEFLGWFEHQGLDTADVRSMVRHYRSFRSRLHFGRNWFRMLSSAYITPLASTDLCGAADFLLDRGIDSRRIFCDLMMLIEPRLASMPFDTLEKSFPPEMVESSPFRRSRPDISAQLEVLEIFRGVDAQDLSDVRPPRRANESFADLLLRDVKANRVAALSLGYLAPSDVDTAEAALKLDRNVTKGGRAAANIVAAGTFAELCG